MFWEKIISLFDGMVTATDLVTHFKKFCKVSLICKPPGAYFIKLFTVDRVTADIGQYRDTLQ